MKKEIKNIRNDALVKAYQVMHDNPTQERQDAVTRQMIRARFLLPVIPVKGKLPEDFPARTLQNEKGEQYLPLFTDMDELRSQQQVIGQSMLIVDISDAYAYLVEHEELKGVIVNPFAKPNLICGRPMCEQLAKLWSRVRTAGLTRRRRCVRGSRMSSCWCPGNIPTAWSLRFRPACVPRRTWKRHGCAWCRRNRTTARRTGTGWSSYRRRLR